MRVLSEPERSKVVVGSLMVCFTRVNRRCNAAREMIKIARGSLDPHSPEYESLGLALECLKGTDEDYEAASRDARKEF